MESAIIFRLNNSKCNFKLLPRNISDDSNDIRQMELDSFASLIFHSIDAASSFNRRVHSVRLI